MANRKIERQDFALTEVTTLKPTLWAPARWVVWIAVGFVFLRGIVSLLPAGKPAAAQAPTSTTAAPATDQTVPGFAALFAREYLAFKPNDLTERAARLEPFLAPGLDRNAGLDFSRATRAQSVAQAIPWHVTPQDPGHWAVTVVAQIQDAPVDSKETPPAPRYLALSVPVSAWKGGFAVSAYPVFVPVPLDKPGLDAAQADPGEPVADQDPEVRDMLLGFLKAYTSGIPAEIRYYLLPGTDFVGLGGQLKLNDLAAFELRKEGDRYWATADAMLLDPVTGVEYRQHMLLELVKQQRWYIKDILQKGAAGQ